MTGTTGARFGMSGRRGIWENMDTDDDPGFGLMLVSGDKGAGKTTLISLLAGDLYDRGFNVVSNISRLFGHQTRDVRDIFTFLKTFPEKTCFALDEVPALLSVYRQATSRPAGVFEPIGGTGETSHHHHRRYVAGAVGGPRVPGGG